MRIINRLNNFFKRKIDWRKTVKYKKGIIKNNYKICLFAHYDKENKVNPFTINYIKILKEFGFEIIFVSTSDILMENELEKIEPYVSIIIIRKNVGYDFGSWATAFSYLKNINKINQIIIANDSVYGPISSLEYTLNKLKESDCDIWGINDSYEIDYHIQSYFICFKNRSISEGFVNKYFNSINIEKTKQEIINNYEVGLMQLAIKLGYKIEVLCNYNEVIQKINPNFSKYETVINKVEFINPTLWLPSILIEDFKSPFIKKELILSNPHNIDLASILTKFSDYKNNIKNQ
jgi:rhamnosyltransferase